MKDKKEINFDINELEKIALEGKAQSSNGLNKKNINDSTKSKIDDLFFTKEKDEKKSSLFILKVENKKRIKSLAKKTGKSQSEILDKIIEVFFEKMLNDK
ncbi:hypothetical protein ACW95P_04770 [Candidatus Mycoplasma pogonae]